jgi:filamentous hemagglutinin family protein
MYRPTRRAALLQGVSLSALLFTSVSVPARAGGAFKSLNQALSLANKAATASVLPSVGITASQQASLGAQNLANAAKRFSSLSAALTAAGAGAPAGSVPIVIDGVSSAANPGGGLAPATGATTGSALWNGAALPVQTSTGGTLTVTVTQTAPLADLTWKSFNIGAKTVLDFNQSAGGTLASSWVVINTVEDPTANPAYILGQIQAPGKVYVLDRNGIAFTAGSQINVGALIAATADIASSQFTTASSGATSFNLYGAEGQTTDPVSGLSVYYAPSFVNGNASAAITVAAGAAIQTASPTGTNGGGYVMLLGGNVANAGLISTPQGQTILAAGQDFTLRQGTTGSTTTGNITSTTLGSEIATTNVPVNGSYVSGSVENSGIVLSDQGDITLVGHAIAQNGVLLSTTTVNTRGTIHLLTPTDGTDPTSSITLGPNSLTDILPEDDGQTALDSQRAADVASSATLNAARQGLAVTSLTNPQLNNHDVLPDQIEESRVELSSGGSITAQSGALVDTPGGQIAMGGGSAVLIQSGATLDVSGSTDAVLPASINDLLVNVEPFQLRDSAANRQPVANTDDAALQGTNVYVDERELVQIATGAYAGNIYTAGGLLEVSGYLGLVPHGIDEWTAIGGQVTLQAQQTLIDPASGAVGTQAGSVVAQAGSLINLQGGLVTYAAGPVHQTYVIASTGQVYNINEAPGNLVYVGLYTGQTVVHSRWGITDTYVNPLLTPAVIEDPSYVVGRDAGTLTVNAGTVVLDGSMPAGVTLGQYQNGPRPATITDPYLLAQTVVPQAGALLIGNYIAGALQVTALQTDVTFQSSTASGSAAPAPDTANIAAAALNADDFATIAVTTSGDITVAGALTTADGGSVSLTGADIDVQEAITAHAGSITLSDQLNHLPLAPSTSVTLASGAMLDTSGVWTNAALDPAHLAGLGLANGGTIAILASQGVTLAAGSSINVGSGGAIMPGGKTQLASGGSVTLVADVVLPPGSGATSDAPVVLDETLIGYGSKGGGTLSITAPSIAIAAPGILDTPASTLVLGESFFSTGFADYQLNGTQALNVLPGAQITVVEPVYVVSDGLAVPTGDDPRGAYSVVLPVLYTPTKGTDTLTERGGASISLLSSVDPDHQASGGGGSLTLAAGASIAVDPGQSITLAAYDQVTVLGTLTAHGGTINVANTRFDPESEIPVVPAPSEFAAGVSVWIGAGALLDVSGEAVVDTDGLGRRFGIAGNGGAIALGGYLPAGNAISTWAQVILRPGAVLDANGAQASVDIVPGTDPGSIAIESKPVVLAGAGGSIAARSLSGIALDGTLTAQAGAADAAGGTLSLTIDPTQLGAYSNIPAYVFQPREIQVTQATEPVQPDPTLMPGDIAPADSFGIARVSQAQLDQGGFASVSLTAQGGAVVFEGDVALHTAGSITLGTGVVGDSQAAGSVSIAAPVVNLDGYTEAADGSTGALAPAVLFTAATGTLSVQADLLTIADTLYLGGNSPVFSPVTGGGTSAASAAPTQTVLTSAFGFAQANFVSTGDIRFLGSTGPVLSQGVLLSLGNIGFTGAQLYPVSEADAQVIAGYDPGLATTSIAPLSAGGSITVNGLGGTAPQAPYSVGGTLQLVASDIVQAGIIRAPEGVIFLNDGDGSNGVSFPSQVTLAPGSETSVSLYGQTIPYGGTVDGVTYLAPGGGAVRSFAPEVEIQAQSVDVQSGATIDLRGGGTLSGAGFVYGRGGTADVLTTPLLDSSGGAALADANAQVTAIQPVDSGDAVYAILPGYASAYAPAATAGDGSYTATKAGEQITIGGEIPGLAAGTYTLLPAYYALLPGGYRVELTTGTLPDAASVALGNYSSLAPVTISTANTGISSPVALAAIVTSGTNVRLLSQYDEETYNAFEAASATQFGAARPFLPEDAKTLDLVYPSTLGTGTALSIAPSALLKTPASGGYGMTLEIDTEITSPASIAVGGPGDSAPAGDLLFSAATLDALDVPRLVLGGNLAPSASSPTTIDITGDATAVTILPHAVLTAGDIMIATAASGDITLLPGGTISTLGAGAAAYDLSDGYAFSSEYGQGTAYPVLAVSNGDIQFVPNTDAAAGAAISIGDGAGVLAGGSLNIIAPSDTNVTVGQANLGAKYAAIAVSAINIGSQAALDALAGQLPSGIDFTAQSLSALLNGNAALGTPAATELTLTATQEVNIIGSVALNSGTTDLVLNTPAIYGVGTASDVASITAPQFTWNGVGTQNFLQVGQGFTNASALPGGQVAAALGQSSGTLQISAGTIVLGYGPQTQANDQVMLNRVIDGFANVVLQASSEITANNQGALAVYARQDVYGAPGSGGNLTLITPLLTTASSAVLDITAGGALAVQSPSATPPGATGSVTALGGQIDLAANSATIDTAVALPSGQFTVTAQQDIDIGAAATIDLSGRIVRLLDQTTTSPGGTLALESTAGNIDLSAGATLSVSGPASGAAAGSLALSALAGDVEIDATLLGSAATSQISGSFSVIAGTLSLATSQAASQVFDLVNAGLDAGGFTASRAFEIGALSTGPGAGAPSTGEIVIGNAANGSALLSAQQISVTADLGGIDVAGTVNAAGTGPGTITLAAQQNLTLEPTGLLDAHASTTATDSTGAPIDAENTALVTLTSTAGSLILNGGTINLTYPGAATPADGPLGQVTLNAPRLGTDSVAIAAANPIAILGAQSIALYAWRSYSPTDIDGTIAQTVASRTDKGGTIVTLDRINADNKAFINAAGANTALASQMAGLIAYGAAFHLRPGVEIDSSAQSGGNLTISGDLDFSALRYSDVGYGSAVIKGVDGSGEPGAVVFRAQNDLIVNGSVSDGFEAPPGATAKQYLKADAGWVIVSPASSPAPDPLNADILLPSSITITDKKTGTATHQIELAAGTTFDETRAISLNYPITISSAQIGANTVVPFSATLADPVIIPQGGFVTTAAITTQRGVIPAGTYLQSGTRITAGSVFAAGTVLPVPITVANNTVVPAGTLLNVFDDSSATLTLSKNTAPLPDNALLPSNTVPLFVTKDGLVVNNLDLRPTIASAGTNEPIEGAIYPLAAMLPAGSLSWSMSFVSGANLASADQQAVLPRSVLDGGALAQQANTADQAPGSLILDDQHYIADSTTADRVSPAFSVIRTGTGDLSLVAGGDFDQSSLYGIYTAGTQDPLPGGATANAPYDSRREGYNGGNFVTRGGVSQAINQITRATYQAYYPNGGGNVLVAAQGSLTGDLYGGSTSVGSSTGLLPSDAVGNWLWRQGSTQLGQPSAWWINFGSFVTPYAAGDQGYASTTPQLVGFQGIGALGGGNVTVIAGQNAGQTTDRSGLNLTEGQDRGEGLVIAVGSTGREISTHGTNTLVETGGGNIAVHIAGTLNPIDAVAYGLNQGGSTVNGAIIDLRGNVLLTAGAVGRDDPVYSASQQANDPIPTDPYSPNYTPSDGITLLPGDGTISIVTQRDLVLDGVGDPGRVTEQNLTRVTQDQVGTLATIGGATGFTLWTADTAIDLFSSGGNVSPITAPVVNAIDVVVNDGATDGRVVYPSQLYVTAASGDIVYGSLQGQQFNTVSLETMPSANEQVSFLAGGSIQANGMAVDMSGADPAGLSTPLDPAFSSDLTAIAGGALTNIRLGGGTVQSTLAIFALEPDTPSSDYLSPAAQAQPALFYAAGGDILDFITGETLTFPSGAQETLSQWYLAAKPVWIEAAQDIVSSGTRPTAAPGALQQNQQSITAPSGSTPITASGDLFLNNTANSVSVVSAGRDILSGYFYVGGPGLLVVTAGRDIDQIGYSFDGVQLLDYGSVKSLGSLLTGAPVSLSGGAGISVMAGLGSGADYTAFADLYLNAANQADLSLDITDPANAGKVQQVYSAALLAWLQDNYGYTGTQAAALSFFLNPANVPLANQDAFLRTIFYQELLASGEQYTDPTSRFVGSYARGRQAIDTLLPGQNGQTSADGAPAGYAGGITMESGSVAGEGSAVFDAGIATEHGGDIQLLDPGGQVVLGTSGGPAPGGGTGLITNGSGDIDVFADGSVLLGKSRIFTNAGGNIQIWSATGNINAGIGARTSVVYSPPVISYDDTGGLVESPAVPTSGAGIATEQPLPSVPAGNIDLTAPIGTIDAGEAGVRSSGNLNLAAARFANASGFSAGGKTSGNSAPATVSLGSVEAAGAAAGAGSAAAQNAAGNRAQEQSPSVIEVEALGVSGGESEEEKRKKRK